MGRKNADVTHASTLDFAGNTTLTKTGKGLHAEQAALNQVSDPWIMTTSNNFCEKMCKPMLLRMGALLMKAKSSDRGPKVAIFPTTTQTK